MILFRVMRSLAPNMVALLFGCFLLLWLSPPTAAWVACPAVSSTKHDCSLSLSTALQLSSSYNSNNNNYDNNNNNSKAQEYRSIADVVGGLHGGKYQFGAGATGIPDTAFSGHGGGANLEQQQQEQEDEQDEDLPNWAKRLAPQESSARVLKVPSNANPMDGMVYSASFEISNQERTWEKFYTKLLTRKDGGFVELTWTSELVVAPKTGFLAPRGGASNACDASQPYSDTATICVTQSSANTSPTDLWLVVGTEEEQWTYKLDLV